jgi:hypothetical protein
VTLVGVHLQRLQVLFLLSGILRFAAAFLCLRIHEPAARGVDALWSAILAPLLRAPEPVVAKAPSRAKIT